MKRPLLIMLAILIGMMLTACASPVETPAVELAPAAAEYGNVAGVVTALDKHAMSNGDKPYYQLIGAYDGMKYDVEPGGYRLEIYVYRDLDKIAEVALQAETVDNQVHIEGNVLLILHTTDRAHLDRLLADLQD